MAGSSSSSLDNKDEVDPALSSAIADLHKFNMMQSMYKSAVHLLEDLSSHSKLLHMPERAQVSGPSAASTARSELYSQQHVSTSS